VNEEFEYRFTLRDYLDIARRRWLWFIGPFVLLSTIAAGVAIWIPPVYESKGTILIESQQIPDELIRSTVTSYAEERIQVIQQLVMTRENLLRIIDKYDLFPDVRSEMTVSEQVDLMRSRITIGTVAGGDLRSRRSNTIAFSVGFEDREPARAYAVANELVTLFLEENVKARTARASETTEFLGQEANRLKSDLEIIEEQIASYKQENGEALPEHLDLHMSMLERTETRIAATELEVKAAQDELRFLQIERSAVANGIAASSAPGSPALPASTGQSLAQAQAELARLEGLYSAKHPDVRRQKALIENLRTSLEALESDTEAPQDSQAADTLASIRSGNLDVARVDAQIDSVRDRIEALDRRGAELEEQRVELEAIIIQTPQVQRALSSLTRDYENTLNKYNEIQAKEMEAKVAESLEEGRKAERFSLIEPPARPERPVKPNRRKITLLGLVLAGLVSFALVVVLEASDRRVRGSNAMLRLFGEHPLVAVPYITTAAEIARRKRLQWGAAAGSAAAVVVALVGIHFFYQPLDMLAIKVMARLG
jgi:polysaccharide chain length determinant protein (PEP-CTERM system associated)